MKNNKINEQGKNNVQHSFIYVTFLKEIFMAKQVARNTPNFCPFLLKIKGKHISVCLNRRLLTHNPMVDFLCGTEDMNHSYQIKFKFDTGKMCFRCHHYIFN